MPCCCRHSGEDDDRFDSDVHLLEGRQPGEELRSPGNVVTSRRAGPSASWIPAGVYLPARSDPMEGKMSWGAPALSPG